jgi:hypothetical protein
MKRAFVRALWGIETSDNQILRRRVKVAKDVELVKLNPFANPFITYVFGKENYKFLTDKGFECKLVSDDPILYCKDMGSHYYTHKMHVWKEAMKDFDEIVFLDWDCIETSPLPKDFWEILNQKSSIQAILRSYKKIKCPWRKVDRRLRPCASFVYIRDKEIPNKLLELWKKYPLYAEEQIIALYTDGLMNGWANKEKYFELFEPPFFTLQHMYSPDLMKTKKPYCVHINKNGIGSILRKIAKYDNTKDKIAMVGKILGR